MKQMGRPGGGHEFGDIDGRKSAIGLLEQKHFAAQAEHDASLPPPSFSEQQIAEALRSQSERRMRPRPASR